MSLFTKPEEEIVAIFDIGNGSIGGALVKLEKHGLPIILYTHREPLTFVPHPTSKYLVSSMLKMLKSVSDHLFADGLSKVKTSFFGSHKLRDAYCIFAAPWYISQTKILHKEQEKPFTVSQDFIKNLMQNEEKQFNSTLGEGTYERIFGPDTQLFEKKIIDTKLNGYDVLDPIGKKAREIDLTLFSSFISKDILSQVEDILHSSFVVRKIHHYSYGLVSWSASQIIFPDVHDYFFLDVSGETTDISLVVKDLLIEMVSFPMGRSSLLRKIVRDMDVTPEVAISFLKMYSAGTLDPEFHDKLKKVFVAIDEDWHDQFVTALKKFQKIYSLPRAAFVTADQDASGFFIHMLEREFPVELNLAKGSLSVTYLNADKLQPFVQIVSEVIPDSFLSIEAVFLNKFH